MKYSARNLKSTFVIGLLLSVATIVPAQNRERFGISARAGGINAVIGQVTLDRADQAPTLLTGRDDLKTGDLVTTGARSYVEVLLNPGSYLRLSENSKFQFEDASLDHLRLKLLQGSAIVEATGIDDMDLNIRVITSQAEFTIMRSGVYRIEAQPNFAELTVRKGRAAFGPNKTDVVKGGNKVTFQNGQMALAKVTKDKDDLDLWSNERAELLARANERLSARTFNGYISSLSAWDSSSWRSSWGIWAYNPRAGFYTFMPFRYGWSSPYGHHYGNYCFYTPHWRGNNSGWAGSGSAGSGSGGFIGGGSGGASGSAGSSGSSGSSGSQGTFGGNSSSGSSQPSSQGSGPTHVHQSRQP